MWEKVLPNRRGAPAISGVTVAKYQKTGQAFLSISKDITKAKRADVFVDGTRVGILPHETGQYVLSQNGARMQLTAPADVRDMLPVIPSTRVSYTIEAGMIVIDTAELKLRQMAAE